MNQVISTINKNFNLTEQDHLAVRKAGELLKPHMQEFVDKWYEWLSTRNEFEMFFGSNPSNLDRVKNLQNQYKDFFSDSDVLKGKSNYQCAIDETRDVEIAPCVVVSRLKDDCWKKCTTRSWQREMS